MEKILEEIIQNNKHLVHRGKVADYIPALKIADPQKVGISIRHVDGNIYSAGDFSHKFTIQSISKVVSLIFAIMDNGEDRVFEKVGYKATDEPFNTLFKLDLPSTKKPANPMINAGAILTSSLILGDGEEKFKRLLDFFRKITQNECLDYNRKVYMSEKRTGDKNKAIAYQMKARGFIEGDVEEILDVYFKQCSIAVDTVDLANIGMFIAKRDADKELNKIKQLTSAIMASSGMYEASGQYAKEVGIPSKNGVGGGIMGTVAKTMGIGVYSPALDQYGNSVVGYGMIKELSDRLDLNIY